MFLQDSVVTQTVVLGGLITLSTSCKFPMMSMCQKLRKLVESRHSYRNEKMGQFFWPALYIRVSKRLLWYYILPYNNFGHMPEVSEDSYNSSFIASYADTLLN